MNGKNIAKYREDNGISQVEMAERLGIAPSTLSRWELNKTAPKGEDYDRLKELIGEEYLTDEDLSETKNDIAEDVSILIGGGTDPWETDMAVLTW